MSKMPPCLVDGFAWLQGMGTNATGGYRFPEYWRRKPVLHERLGKFCKAGRQMTLCR